ncbi:hypothetical protein IVE04_08540 [Pseudomonas mendocina]|nr:hypothetical protein [Pseudomonas mendocina]
MINKQNQSGGDHSTNIQAQQMVVHVGIDEKRAREVFHEMNLQLKQEYTQEALRLANERVLEFENCLIPKMEKVEGALEAFADPSFQILLLEAQKTAASTERPTDYKLLSELLFHRFVKGDNRIARAGISLAVDIVDKVADDALLGLTAAHAVSNLVPTAGDIHQGLDVLESLFKKIIYGQLPSGYEWLDHLDVLNAARLNSLGTLKKIQKYYPEKLSGYIDCGIKKDSDSHSRAIEILKSNNLPPNVLVQHALNPDFVRIPVAQRVQIDTISLQQPVVQENSLSFVQVRLSDAQKAAMYSIYDLYMQDSNIRQANIDTLMKDWDERPSLKALRDWWDSIPASLTITSAGKVLAHANAQRCDNTLPPLD